MFDDLFDLFDRDRDRNRSRDASDDRSRRGVRGFVSRLLGDADDRSRRTRVSDHDIDDAWDEDDRRDDRSDRRGRTRDRDRDRFDLFED